MQLIQCDDLICVNLHVSYQGQEICVPGVVVDTGSATTLLAADYLSKVDITPAPDDALYTVRGVGGSEVVFSRHVDFLRVGEQSLPDFEVEVGGLQYGFVLNGILGMDFLLAAGAIINLSTLELTFTQV